MERKAYQRGRKAAIRSMKKKAYHRQKKHQKYRAKASGYVKQQAKSHRIDLRIETAKKYFHDKKSVYTHYLLALQWPITFKLAKHSNTRPLSQIPKKTWTPHGLWPNADKKWIQSCHPRTKLHWDLMSPDFRKYLTENFPTLMNDQKHFMEHEWERHGTCWNPNTVDINKIWDTKLFYIMSDIPKDLHGSDDKKKLLVLQKKYLELTVTLSKHFDIYKILKSNKILPRKTKHYQMSMIKTAIYKKLKVKRFQIICSQKKSRFLLSEIRICLDLNMKAVNCKKMKSFSCKSWKVWYPM